MNKTTIEIERKDNHPAGYGQTYYFTSESGQILDKLVEWSKLNNVNIYRHIVRYEQEKIGELGSYNFDKSWSQNDIDRDKLNIQRCHLVCYLDIYYQ